jgi:signal transduction histidine kinase
MVDTARALTPNLEQIALVGDPLERARPSFKQDLPALVAELRLIDLTGLPMAELRRRVAALPERTVIAYTDIYVDGAGVNYDPRDAMVAFAEAANRPIVVDAESYIGLGSVGGRVISPGVLGDELARLALRILNGENVANIPIAKSASVKPIFDDRQLKRWQISEASLPEGSEVRYGETTAWEQYHTQIWIALAAVLLQTAIILGLLLERRRRHAAELESRGRLAQVMHMNRGAGLSAISSSIAHELNQPLGAILSNAQAAEILLKQPPPQTWT